MPFNHLNRVPCPATFSNCFAGNDLNEDITPIQAGLAWTVGKRRREAFDFLGGQVGAGAAGTQAAGLGLESAGQG